MALSNIFNEPRREITEQVIGVVVGLGLLCADVFLSYFLVIWAGTKSKDIIHFTILSAMFIPVIVPFATMVILLATHALHALGENICDYLAAKGMDPRPQQRYHQD